MKIKLYQPQAIQEQGKRPNQEDSIYPLLGEAVAEDRLFVLCDGMGGHERGEVASNAICQGLGSFLKEQINNEGLLTDDQFEAALEYAYQQLDGKDNGEFLKAGTTMTMLCFHRGGCTAAHIGDSRIYHIRPFLKSILYKSRDHSLVFELYQSGEITYDEMKTHPRKNQISRAVVPGKDNRQKADIVHITDIQPGDYFVICSDGILESIDDEELVSLLASNTEDDYKRQRLIEMTGDSDDNHSAYIVHVSEVTAEEGDASLLNDEQTVKFNAINIHPVAPAHAEEDVVRVVSAETAETAKTGRLADSHETSMMSHASKPVAKGKSSSTKWLPFLLGAVVVAAAIIVYAMMVNPPKGDKDVQEIVTDIKNESPVETPAPTMSSETPHPAVSPEIHKTSSSVKKSKQDLNAKKVVTDKKDDTVKEEEKKTTEEGKKSEVKDNDGHEQKGTEKKHDSEGSKNQLEELKKREQSESDRKTEEA